jgi:hypothetical protein
MQAIPEADPEPLMAAVVHMKAVSNFCTVVACITALLSLRSCTKEPDPPGGSIILGRVSSYASDESIHPAYIILGDELLATTGAEGSFRIDSPDPGTFELLCSALDYLDQTVQVKVETGRSSTVDFHLVADDRAGRVYGEFQDSGLYSESLLSHPSMADWTAKEQFDGVTGATLQSMTFGGVLPARKVYLGDSLLCFSDDFGQFWAEIQCGTYPLTGSCEGYRSQMRIIRVEPGERTYANFFLSRAKEQ